MKTPKEQIIEYVEKRYQKEKWLQIVRVLVTIKKVISIIQIVAGSKEK